MSLQNAFFKNLDTGEAIKVQFNPTDLTFNKTAQFAEIAIPGLDSPVLQFIRGGNETLTVELFFDTTAGGMGVGARSVTGRVNRFYALVKQNRDTHAPPKCLFTWGVPGMEAPNGGVAEDSPNPTEQFGPVSNAPFWFTCVIESIDRKFLLFSPEGVPLRARVTVKMREHKTIKEMVAELQSADHTKARVLKHRERLDLIAAKEYGDPAEWRRIAEANDFDDPRRVRPGTPLSIPPKRIESTIRSSR